MIFIVNSGQVETSTVLANIDFSDYLIENTYTNNKIVSYFDVVVNYPISMVPYQLIELEGSNFSGKIFKMARCPKEYSLRKMYQPDPLLRREFKDQPACFECFSDFCLKINLGLL